MSDEKDFSILPTRDNHPAGKSNENRMLAKTGRLGNDSFIKDQRNIVGPEGQKGIVRLKTRGGMPEFTTEFEEPEDEELERCPLTDHGLVDCYYTENVLGYPPQYSEDIALEKLVDWDGSVVKARHIKSDPKTLENLRLTMPSMFSGLMRRVVQMENGKRRKSNPTIPRFDFSPTFTITHGLWCTSEGVRWLIEIEGASVYVRQITFCRKLSKNWQSFEQSLEAKYDKAKLAKVLAPYWTPTKVSSVRTLIGTLPALNGGPHYQNFGWAFNYDGSRACIVTTEGRTLGYAECSWNTLYELTFTADEFGKPSSVSCSKLDEDWFNNRNTKEGVVSDYGSLQVPYGPSGKCKTYGFWSPVSPQRDIDAPVFAYYLKNGGMHVLRFYSPHKEPEYSDEGSNVESIPVNKRRFGQVIDMGGEAQVPVDFNPPISFPEPWFDNNYVNALSARNVSDRKFLEVGSFYSAHVPKASGSETLSTLKHETYEDGPVSYVDDNLGDTGYTIGRHHIFTDNEGRSWYLRFNYETVYQPIRVAQTAERETWVDWSRVHFPFAVIHGHDRESYCAGYHEVELKKTVVKTTENSGTFMTALGDVCQTLGYIGMYGDYPLYAIGAWNVTEVTYPAYGPPVGGVAGATTETEELEEKAKLVSKLVIGDQVFDLPSSGFGYYGPDALNFLYFRAAASAFGDSGVSKIMRSPDFQDLHLRTNCGSYTTTDVSNSFVGVI